ncbi:MAG: ABC transporter permease [Acidobacteriia bacterium]|nr:ABC transporter permease [Terriglobia bacterium]
MRLTGRVLGAGFLAAVVAASALAPILHLRDPAAQPDGLVLRDLPPLSRVDAVRLAGGGLLYAHEVRAETDGSVSVRRGATWERLAPSALAGPAPADWHARPRFSLGTDGFGRDLLSRLLYGARVSLLVSLLAALLSVTIGAAAGLAAGLLGGVADGLLMRVADVFLSVPRLFFLLLLVALYGPSLSGTVLVLAATSWMAAARLVRAEILSLRERDFVRAAEAAGASRARLALLHLLPGAAAPLLVEGTLRVASTLLLESSLSYLGLGVPRPMPSWGNLIADGRDTLLGAWWIATLPGFAIAATVLAVHAVGEGLRDRIDPKTATRA